MDSGLQAPMSMQIPQKASVNGKGSIQMYAVLNQSTVHSITFFQSSVYYFIVYRPHN